MQRRSSAIRRQTTPSPATTSSIFDIPDDDAPTPDIPAVLVGGSHSANPSSHPTSWNDAKLRQLEELVASLRGRLTAVRIRPDRDTVREEELKAAHDLFWQIRGQCRALSTALLAEDREKLGHGRTVSTASSTSIDGVGIGLKSARRMSRVESGSCKVEGGGGGDVQVDKNGGCAAGRSPRKQVSTAWVSAVREWRACLEELAAAHKLSLTNTYKRHEQFATPEILHALFADRKSRAQVVSGWMKNFGAYKRMQGQSGVWSKWETQFQNYEHIVHELAEITCLLQGLDSGITPNRVINDITIAPRGDTVLEFANTTMDWKPVLRFRVSSHMLAEASPIFASLFSKPSEPEDPSTPTQPGKQGEEDHPLPPPPTPFICKDGTRTLLHRMPQLEADKYSALTILLHAAHMHNDRVPREVSFGQLLALAEASLRYRCTSPLEIFVEHRWLPQWVHKATDAMPDGLLLISYAFGLRRLFTRVTKTAILNLVDERELAGKDWPRGIKERIWAVREAKMAQVYRSCARAVEEYLRPTRGVESETTEDVMEGVSGGSRASTPVGSPPRSVAASSYMAPSLPSIFSHGNSSAATLLNNTLSPRAFTSTPRCPKGSHWCDATNLGWLMLVYNELQLLSSFLNTETLAIPSTAPPARSLAQIVEALRSMASPPQHPDHRSSGSSVCDPAPAFRTAINDVYNSVSGLTLYEIDGTRHGWALSSRHVDEPQVVLSVDSPGMNRQEEPSTVDELTAAMGGLDFAEGESRAVTEAMGDLELSEDESQEAQLVSPAEEVFRDEGICLRILGSIDAFPDLHNAAIIDRHVYAVYKQNELELMRTVVRADRRRTVLLLAGDKPSDDLNNPTSPEPFSSVDEYLQHLIEDGSNPPPSEYIPSVFGDSYTSDDESTTETETAPSPSTSSPTRTANRTDSPVPSYSTRLSRRSTRSSINPYFKMTEEEARQILWPEPSPPLSPQLSTPEVTAFRAVRHGIEEGKFGRAGVEDKMLVGVGNKMLREDMDRRMGLT